MGIFVDQKLGHGFTSGLKPRVSLSTGLVATLAGRMGDPLGGIGTVSGSLDGLSGGGGAGGEASLHSDFDYPALGDRKKPRSKWAVLITADPSALAKSLAVVRVCSECPESGGMESARRTAQRSAQRKIETFA